MSGNRHPAPPPQFAGFPWLPAGYYPPYPPYPPQFPVAQPLFAPFNLNPHANAKAASISNQHAHVPTPNRPPSPPPAPSITGQATPNASTPSIPVTAAPSEAASSVPQEQVGQAPQATNASLSKINDDDDVQFVSQSAPDVVFAGQTLAPNASSKKDSDSRRGPQIKFTTDGHHHALVQSIVEHVSKTQKAIVWASVGEMVRGKVPEWQHRKAKTVAGHCRDHWMMLQQQYHTFIKELEGNVEVTGRKGGYPKILVCRLSILTFRCHDTYPWISLH